MVIVQHTNCRKQVVQSVYGHFIPIVHQCPLQIEQIVLSENERATLKATSNTSVAWFFSKNGTSNSADRVFVLGSDVNQNSGLYEIVSDTDLVVIVTKTSAGIYVSESVITGHCLSYYNVTIDAEPNTTSVPDYTNTLTTVPSTPTGMHSGYIVLIVLLIVVAMASLGVCIFFIVRRWDHLSVFFRKLLPKRRNDHVHVQGRYVAVNQTAEINVTIPSTQQQ